MPKKVRRICRHCGYMNAYMPKQLCWRCFHDPEIVKLYSPLRVRARRALEPVNVKLLTPDESTVAEPGTEEKIAVMRERLERGESCFHPDDPRICHASPYSGYVTGRLRSPRTRTHGWEHASRRES